MFLGSEKDGAEMGKKSGEQCCHVMYLLNALAVGGSERKSVRLANALTERGWKQTIAYLNEPHALRDEISPEIDVLFLGRRGKFGIGALQRLRAYISRNNIDVICCINLYPLIYAYLARCILAAHRPKVLATTNTTDFLTPKNERQMMLYSPVLRRIDKIIFGSIYQQELWISRYELDPSSCTYIHNGVNVDLFRQSALGPSSKKVRSEIGISESSVIVGSIGRFSKEKQYDMVIRACVRLRKENRLDVHCLLVGGGNEESLLRKLVSDLHCAEYVHLIGMTDDVRPYLDAMDVFVLSSVSETFSNAALEAMSMSLPVVLPRVGGCPEMVKSGETGFIYEPGNMSQFIDYLSLLCGDGERRSEMGRAARKHIDNSFRFEAMVDAYANLFETVA